MSRSPGSRVATVQVLCGSCRIPSYSPLDLKKTYSILVTEYMLQGGDEYDQFIKAPGVKIEILRKYH